MEQIEWQTFYRCVHSHHPVGGHLQFKAGNDYPLIESDSNFVKVLNHNGKPYNMRVNSQFTYMHFTIVKVALLNLITMEDPVAVELLGISKLDKRSILTVRELETKAVWVCLHVHGKDELCGFAIQDLEEADHIVMALSFAKDTEHDRNKAKHGLM